ncbi:MAG: PKD domain-containing protein [Candidatus Zixiibacteriota bacterium]
MTKSKIPIKAGKPLIFLIMLLVGITASAQTLGTNPDSIPFALAVNYPTGVNPHGIYCADLDGDGDLDIATANTGSQNVTIWKNDGHGVFNVRTDCLVWFMPLGVVAAKLDTNNYLDLAVTNRGPESTDPDSVSVLFNNGNGAFGNATNFAVGDKPGNLRAADFDGDGKIDLAVANAGDPSTRNSVSILINDGFGRFHLVENHAGAKNPAGICAAFLDADSNMDLAVTSANTDSISILINNGNGTFHILAEYKARSFPVAVFAADLDEDGDNDLAVANAGCDSVSVLINNGNGTFQIPKSYKVGQYPGSVFASDLDGDGYKDLVTANQWGASISILRNNGDGTFRPAINYTVGNDPIEVFAADLDNDGDNDLAVTNSSDNNVSILINLTKTRSLYADFKGVPRSGYAPLQVQFTDSTRGNPTSWHWEFGDGNTATVKNPVHIYTDTGYFDVKLTVSDSTSSDSIVKTNYIDVFNALTVDFTAQPTHGRKPLLVSFHSTFNRPPDSVRWYFGDGDSSDSLNPQHQYNQVGSYDVKLVAELAGYKDSLTKEDYVKVSDVKANFSASKRCGSLPLTVTFNDSSTSTYPIIAWHWNFGDGATSNQQYPTHQYTSSSIFDVTLIASDSISADTLTKRAYITTQDSVSADFFGLPKSGRSPLTVMFEPVLEGIANQYFWDFGDDSTSTTRNPIHIFTSQGKYNVKLKVKLELDDCDQVDSVMKTDYVIVNDLEARFIAHPTAGAAPLLVQFTDSSRGNPSNWFWDFGDGHTSTAQDPQHQYDSAGIYDVFLRVSNFISVDSLLKLDHILVTDTLFPDLSAEITGGTARPGFDLNYIFYWTNTGTSSAENCTLKILLPTYMTLNNVLPGEIRAGTYSGHYSTGDTLIIPLAGIEPTNWYGGNVYVMGHLPVWVQTGDTLVCRSWLTSPTTEQNYTNNQASFSQLVVGSWDPNDKLASPEGKGTSHAIEPNQRIEYTIRFENKREATADAIYIRAVDTLDQDLNWASFDIGTMSHPNKCRYEFDPYSGVIVWSCDSIMLPPNVNPPEGEGYFTFSISPKAGLPAGTRIANTSWIRFDYNEWLQAPEQGPVVRTIKYSHPGDANTDGHIDAGDVIYLVNYLFKGGPAPDPLPAGDATCNGIVDAGDIVYLVNYLFKGGLAPSC